jgi:hypothetical protein
MMPITRFIAFAVTFAFVVLQPVAAQTKDDAAKALKQAATFYRMKVASHGGYVYYYSVDLKERWGEGKATTDTLFVQPPGTPTVGMAYLKAWQATGDKFYLDAARETAEALVYGQLKSGGWTQTIHFGPAKRVGKYRNGKGGNWNVSSLDDGQSQAALEMLIRADQALSFKNAEIHEAVEFGLDALLKAQFPSGGFPQVWMGPVAAKPVLKAKYPNFDWKTEGKIRDYYYYYTLNDDIAGRCADVFILAHRTYKDDKYKAALEKLGDFLILAQMPDPQPGWCQQYNDDMMPMWGRKFEPPAITGWESQDAMEALIQIAGYTGKKKYLDPLPRALAYFQKSLLPDGRVARFYEFKSNKPLYMNAKYEITYDDSSAPGHYGWKQPARFKEIERLYQNAVKNAPPPAPRGDKELTEAVRGILKNLDAEGRWITSHDGSKLVGQPRFETGFRYISSDVFSKNVETLAEFISR